MKKIRMFAHLYIVHTSHNEEKLIIMIETEHTPNPDTLKFLPGKKVSEIVSVVMVFCYLLYTYKKTPYDPV